MKWEHRCSCRIQGGTGQRCKLRRVNNLETCHVHAETCPICLTSLAGTDDASRLSCGHRYHAGCIYKWIDNSSQCPLCRGEVCTMSHSSSSGGGDFFEDNR